MKHHNHPIRHQTKRQAKDENDSHGLNQAGSGDGQITRPHDFPNHTMDTLSLDAARQHGITCSERPF